eukprot:1839291-Karenia_brevis.AAC.1
MPSYLAITATLYQLPTTTKYVIQVNGQLPLHGGLHLDASEVARTISERLTTWMNPTSAEIEVRLDS